MPHSFCSFDERWQRRMLSDPEIVHTINIDGEFGSINLCWRKTDSRRAPTATVEIDLWNLKENLAEFRDVLKELGELPDSQDPDQEAWAISPAEVVALLLALGHVDNTPKFPG